MAIRTSHPLGVSNGAAHSSVRCRRLGRKKSLLQVAFVDNGEQDEEGVGIGIGTDIFGFKLGVEDRCGWGTFECCNED